VVEGVGVEVGAMQQTAEWRSVPRAQLAVVMAMLNREQFCTQTDSCTVLTETYLTFHKQGFVPHGMGLHSGQKNCSPNMKKDKR
jgi:hypothetical protein